MPAATWMLPSSVEKLPRFADEAATLSALVFFVLTFLESSSPFFSFSLAVLSACLSDSSSLDEVLPEASVPPESRPSVSLSEAAGVVLCPPPALPDGEDGAPMTEALTVSVMRLTESAATTRLPAAFTLRLRYASAESLTTATPTAAPMPTLAPAAAASAVRKRAMLLCALTVTLPAAPRRSADVPMFESTYTPETPVADTGVADAPPSDPAAA